LIYLSNHHHLGVAFVDNGWQLVRPKVVTFAVLNLLVAQRRRKVKVWNVRFNALLQRDREEHQRNYLIKV
jgi:hypothetical protein